MNNKDSKLKILSVPSRENETQEGKPLRQEEDPSDRPAEHKPLETAAVEMLLSTLRTNMIEIQQQLQKTPRILAEGHMNMKKIAAQVVPQIEQQMATWEVPAMRVSIEMFFKANALGMILAELAYDGYTLRIEKEEETLRDGDNKDEGDQEDSGSTPKIVLGDEKDRPPT